MSRYRFAFVEPVERIIGFEFKLATHAFQTMYIE